MYRTTLLYGSIIIVVIEFFFKLIITIHNCINQFQQVNRKSVVSKRFMSLHKKLHLKGHLLLS